MSGFPPENDIAPDSSTSTSECWPEETVLWGGRTSAKPRWSEVIIFVDALLRRGGSSPEENGNPIKKHINKKGDPP